MEWLEMDKTIKKYILHVNFTDDIEDMKPAVIFINMEDVFQWNDMQKQKLLKIIDTFPDTELLLLNWTSMYNRSEFEEDVMGLSVRLLFR